MIGIAVFRLVLLILFVLLAFSVVVAVLCLRLIRSNRQLQQELSESLGAATERVDWARTELAKAGEQRLAAEQLAAREKNRADEQFKCIQDVESERDRLWLLYRDMSLGAGAAQDLLYQELDRLLRLYNRQAKRHGFEPVQVRSDIRNALDGFKEAHRQEESTQHRTPVRDLD